MSVNKIKILSGMVAASLAVGVFVVGGHDYFAPADKHSDHGTTEDAGLPWQIETLPGGASKVMGLTLAPAGGQGSTLADAQTRWGADMQIAIIAAPGEDGLLEGFVDPARAGFVTGKVVLSFRMDAATVRAMRGRAIKSEFMESTTRKYTLTPDDLHAALKAPLTAMSFIPQANLDEGAIVGRFGEPAERIAGADKRTTHFLYPAKGLDLALNSEGKELLQYVAPAEFQQRLRAPLAKQPAPKP